MTIQTPGGVYNADTAYYMHVWHLYIRMYVATGYKVSKLILLHVQRADYYLNDSVAICLY